MFILLQLVNSLRHMVNCLIQMKKFLLHEKDILQSHTRVPFGASVQYSNLHLLPLSFKLISLLNIIPFLSHIP